MRRWREPWSGSGRKAIAEVETILVVAAEAREVGGLLARCGRVQRLRWRVDFARRAECNGRQFLIVANGAGAIRAADAFDVATGQGRVDRVVSAGTCGALDPVLKPGDIFVASKVEAPEPVACFTLEGPASTRAHATGTLASVNHVVRTVAEKRTLRASGAGAVEMEAAGVAARASLAGIPFYCVRVVLDTADEGFSIDFEAARGSDGSLRTSRILGSALGRPWTRIPELFGLYWRSRVAARSLGDFLADCRF